MIQRIQSFLLVLACVGVALCYMFPVATAGDYGELNLWPLGAGNWYLAALNLLVGLIALVSIFMYKNRVRQMRVVTVAALLSVIQIALVFLVAVEAFGKHLPAGTDISYSIGSYIPLVTTVLLFIAQRCIRNDEMKVRAADRIR